jgi:hypothetical protein
MEAWQQHPDILQDLQAALSQAFLRKDIRYMYGDQDTKSCNVGTCSDKCAPMLTGSNRLQRGMNYFSHLRSFFNGTYEPKYGIYSGGHHDWDFYHSAYFCEFFFDPSACKRHGITTTTPPESDSSLSSGWYIALWIAIVSILVAALLLASFCCWRKSRKTFDSSSSDEDDEDDFSTES